jgi:addiction module HigA family antidote
MRAYALAAHLRVPRTRIERLIREETPGTPDTALRLARHLGTTPDFWLGLQAQVDLETMQDGMSEEITAIKPRSVA